MSLFRFLNLSKANFGNLQGRRRKQLPELDVSISTMHTRKVSSRYQSPCNFEEKLWKCYHGTRNRPHSIFFGQLRQSWCNIISISIEKKLRIHVAVSILHQLVHFNIHDILWVALTIEHWGNIENLTLQYWRYQDIANFKLWFQRYKNFAHAIFLVNCELKLLSNFKATLHLSD